LLKAREISGEELQRVWAAEVTYLQGFGVTPELRGYEEWKASPSEKERPALELYERVKSFYLASTDMSYWDKVKALVRLHPQGTRVDIFRQIKNEVFPTISEKDIDPGILRHYQSRYDKSKTDEPYAQWLIHQGLASLEGGAGVGEETPSRLTRGTTTRPTGFEFEPAFEEERLGLQGSQIWKNWYEDRFGLEIRRFKGQVEDQTEETWATFLKGQTPKLREEFLKQGEFRRGESSARQAGRIKTVRF